MSNPNPQQTYNQYLIRHFSNINHFGVTIPKQIAEVFNKQKIKFNIEMIKSDLPITLSPGTYIVLKSGLDIAKIKEELNYFDLEKY